MQYRRRYVLVLAKIVLLYFGTLSAAWAQQAQWTPEMLQPPASTRGPSDPLRIRLAQLPPKALELLTLESDEIDVTSMITMKGDVAVFTPLQPLAYAVPVWTTSVNNSASRNDSSRVIIQNFI